ncbi:MAG TPA: DUF3467 domain-containing protein [Candidatus Paceibacterota bacterium]
MEPESNEIRKEIAIAMPADAKPAFSNATQVTVSDDSVVIQFAYLRPHATTGQLVGEVVLSPKHAIEFSKALDDTIKKHFTRHLEGA